MNPICRKCVKEMVCVENGTIVYHPYEHAEPNTPAQEKVGGITVVNTDVLIEGGWKEGDIDFAVRGDTYECPICKTRIVTGFGGKLIDYQVEQKVLQRLVKKAREKGCSVEIRRK